MSVGIIPDIIVPVFLRVCSRAGVCSRVGVCVCSCVCIQCVC